MNIHYLQHVPFEGLGSIEQWAQKRGHQLFATRFYQGDHLPPVQNIDMLVILGGPMSVTDRLIYPWLDEEKVFIQQVIMKKKIVFGVCLGAQLIAESLGGNVYLNLEKEIGWHPVYKEERLSGIPLAEAIGNTMKAFHWHGETFTLPEGAIRLATSPACKNQGFVYTDKVAGFQFHLEMTGSAVRRLIEYCGDEIVEGGSYIQSADAILSDPALFEKSNEVMDNVLDCLVR